MISEGNSTTLSLPPQELKAVYAISRVVAASTDIEAVLNEVISIARPVFIFDQIILFLRKESDTLEPVYARVIGRGRLGELDLSLSLSVANQVLVADALAWENKGNESLQDRSEQRLYLGLPVRPGRKIRGALIFTRFGGPPFTQEQAHLAEFIAMHIAQVLEHSQLVEQIASLEARRRLDSLQEDFVAMITHELLSPLGFIKGYATTLLREDTVWQPDTQREFLQIIDDEADRLQQLIEDLLDTSRLQAGTLYMSMQTISLETLLRDIVLRASSHYEDLNIELEIQLPGLKIHADPARITQVFENIISNARKYAPGSPVKITAQLVRDHVCILVADRGPGIAPIHLDHLFERFYRADDQTSGARGTGLGLYICRQIIQAHNGEITVDSTLGEGTTFYICLPWLSQINSLSEDGSV